jgi:hypothetical protein
VDSKGANLRSLHYSGHRFTILCPCLPAVPFAPRVVYAAPTVSLTHNELLTIILIHVFASERTPHKA